MLKFQIDQTNLIVELQPDGQLAAEDFARLSLAVDKLIQEKGSLNGMMIETESFPGWESLKAMSTHFKFVKDHHKKINKIALVTNSPLGNFSEKIVSHFISAKVKKFQAGENTKARDWILNN